MTDTNNEGRFIFPSLDLSGESSAMIQGVKEKGGRDLLLKIDEPKLTEYSATENVDPFNGADSTADDRAQQRYLEMKAKLAMSKTKVLQEVTVTAKVLKDDRRQLYSGVPVRKMAVTSDNCYTVSSILQMLQGRFAGVTVFSTTEGGVGGYNVVMRGHNSFLGDLPPAFLLDGFIVSLDVIGNVRPCSVESIEVSTSVFPALNKNGIISVLTKNGNPNFAAVYPEEPIPGRIMTRIKGYQVAREFYSPKYIASTPGKKETADIRTTVYWNPLIKTDADGNAKVTFWNTDERGTVHLNLQGVSLEGTPISVTSEYKVE